MSLIVEDGSGKSDAESYTSVAFCDDYFTKRGNTSWGVLDLSIKEAALRNATDYMLQKYRGKWLGRRRLTTQALDWPRVGVVIEDFVGGTTVSGYSSYGLFQVPYDIVPLEVNKACAELALRSTMGTLLKDQTQKVTRKTVGPITVVYDENSSDQKAYVAVDMTLSVYLSPTASGNIVKLVRT